jgi:hypothetical protein
MLWTICSPPFYSPAPLASPKSASSLTTPCSECVSAHSWDGAADEEKGNRASKHSAFEFDAFKSYNLPPLASLGIDVHIDWSLVCRPTVVAPFRAHDSLCPNVFALRVVPTLTGGILRAMLAAPTRGLVLETVSWACRSVTCASSLILGHSTAPGMRRIGQTCLT